MRSAYIEAMQIFNDKNSDIVAPLDGGMVGGVLGVGAVAQSEVNTGNLIEAVLPYTTEAYISAKRVIATADDEQLKGALDWAGNMLNQRDVGGNPRPAPLGTR